MDRRSGLLCLLACTLAPGCRSVPVDAHAAVASVRITPGLDTIPFGGSVSLVATALDALGNPTVPIGHPVWTSYSPTVVTVDTGGNVKSIWYGQGSVHVEIDGAGSNATIYITDPPIDTVLMGPINLSDVERGDTIQLSATAYNTVPLPIRTGLTWSVSDSTVLRVDSTGKVVALKVGTATVSASLGGRIAGVPVHVLVPAVSVTAVPDSFTVRYDQVTMVRIVPRDSVGNPLTDRPVTLSQVPGGTAVGFHALQPAGDTLSGVQGVTPGSAMIAVSVGHRTDTLRVRVAPLALRTVSAGTLVTCGISSDSAAYCWGLGTALGAGYDSGWVPRPRVVAGGMKWVAVSAGEEQACGLTDQGAAYCWGTSLNGLIFGGQPYVRLVPVLAGGAFQFAELADFEDYVCGITPSGDAVCWGIGAFAPAVIPGGLSYRHIYLGAGGNCASQASDSAIYCWQGYPPTSAPLDSAVPLTSFAAGNWGHSCGLASGALYCWGPFQRWFAPGTFTGVAVTRTAVCVLDASGAASCGATDSPSATLVPQNNPVPLISITAGWDQVCGIGTDGLVYCWGNNQYGQLGVIPLSVGPVPPHAVMNQK